MINDIEKRYLDKSYLMKNPTWDNEHTPWKTQHIKKILRKLGGAPKSICEIGCGSGGILVELNKEFPTTDLYGFDISPDLKEFWDRNEKDGIKFKQGDFFTLEHPFYDVILVIDVLEHLSDPFTFLQLLKGKAGHYIFHIPLDLSALSVIGEKSLLDSREKVGHIHYYTKSLALAMLTDAGYQIESWCYTNAYVNGPESNIKTHIAMLPRMLLQAINKDWGVRVLGGETLMVLASLSTTINSECSSDE